MIKIGVLIPLTFELFNPQTYSAISVRLSYSLYLFTSIDSVAKYILCFVQEMAVVMDGAIGFYSLLCQD